MLFAYLTLDEVNQELAGMLADAAGVELDATDFRDACPDRQFDAVLYDLDYLPNDRREALLAALTAGRMAEPVAVHSYRLSVRQARALRQQGVIVARRLGPKLFARLLAGRPRPRKTMVSQTNDCPLS